jgi:membrane protein implicated in regulation of membrane protease activity
MAGHGDDYQRGHMDITEQAATYELVMGMTKWGSLAIVAGVLFFTLLFCTAAGFVGSAIATVLLIVAGFVFLRDKPDAAGAH